MKSQKPAKKSKPALIWAIDPMEGETRPTTSNFEAVSRWAKDLNWDIQPVTIVTPTMKDLSRGLLGSVNHVQAALDSYLKKYPKMRSGRVLVNQASTQASAVAKLLSFAKQEGAPAIAVSSHGRSGLDRMLLGSFAENVLEASPLPVFFLNHKPLKKSKRAEVVLFPTDFSDDSWLAFREFLRIASGGKIEVVLFHAITYPLPLNTGMGMYLPDGYIEDQEKWARGESSRWLEEAKKRDVKAEAVIRTGGVGFTSGEAVLEAAEEFKASAVVVTSNSNAVGRFLVGSIAYPVFRANQFLTLVYGPMARALHRANKDDFSFAEANG